MYGESWSGGAGSIVENFIRITRKSTGGVDGPPNGSPELGNSQSEGALASRGTKLSAVATSGSGAVKIAMQAARNPIARADVDDCWRGWSDMGRQGVGVGLPAVMVPDDPGSGGCRIPDFEPEMAIGGVGTGVAVGSATFTGWSSETSLFAGVSGWAMKAFELGSTTDGVGVAVGVGTEDTDTAPPSAGRTLKIGCPGDFEDEIAASSPCAAGVGSAAHSVRLPEA
jgi:hypothetical protein